MSSRPSSSFSPKIGRTSSTQKVDDTIKAYEARIRSLERLLQENYHKSNDTEGIAEKYQYSLEEERASSERKEFELSKVRAENAKLRAEIAELQRSNQTKSSIKGSKSENEVLEMNKKLESENKQNNKLLSEVCLHLTNCRDTLKLVDDSGQESRFMNDNLVRPDQIRATMREIEDEIRNQTNLLLSLKNASINNSVEDEHASVNLNLNRQSRMKW